MNKPNKFTFYAPIDMFAMAFPDATLPENVEPYITVRVDWWPSGTNDQYNDDAFSIRRADDENAMLAHYTGPEALRIAVMVDEENQ